MSAGLITAFTLCRWLGLFPPETDSKLARAMYRAYQVTFFAVVSTVSMSMTIQLFAAPDLTVLARTIDMWTLCWTGLYKWTCMAVRARQYSQFHWLLFDVQSQGARTYDGDSGPGSDRFTVDRLKSLKVVSHSYVLSGFVVVTFLTAGFTMTYPQGNRTELEYFNDPRSYPLCCWIPFVVSNYWTFIALWTLKYTVLLSGLIMYLIIDTYMFGAIFAMGIQLELLNESLANIGSSFDDTTEESKSSNNIMLFKKQEQSKCYSLLCECLKHHYLILNYISTLRIMFSKLILFDYLHAITSLTFAMFQTTKSVGPGEAISLSAFIVICLYHQFLNNFFGESIIQKQLSVQEAVYEFPWLRVDKKCRQLLTIMICRANKPITISGFYMYILCNRSFIMFIKALYTYYMVLRKVNI